MSFVNASTITATGWPDLTPQRQSARAVDTTGSCRGLESCPADPVGVILAIIVIVAWRMK